MGVGHGDTVWPLGTLASMPWREADGRLWGPGVLDMKGGLAFFVYAMRCLRELDIPVGRPVALWVVSDEEVGSEGSRPRTEALAKESFARWCWSRARDWRPAQDFAQGSGRLHGESAREGFACGRRFRRGGERDCGVGAADRADRDSRI